MYINKIVFNIRLKTIPYKKGHISGGFTLSLIRKHYLGVISVILKDKYKDVEISQ